MTHHGDSGIFRFNYINNIYSTFQDEPDNEDFDSVNILIFIFHYRNLIRAFITVKLTTLQKFSVS